MFLACIIMKRSGAKTRIKSNARKNRTKLTELSTKLRRDQPYRHRFIFLCYSVNTTSSNCEEKRLFRIDNFPFSIFSHLSRLKRRGGWFLESACWGFSLASVLSHDRRDVNSDDSFFTKLSRNQSFRFMEFCFLVLFFVCLSGCFICLCLLPALAQILDYLQ